MKKLLHIPTASVWHISPYTTVEKVSEFRGDIKDVPALIKHLKEKFGNHLSVFNGEFLFDTNRNLPEVKEYEFEVVDL